MPTCESTADNNSSENYSHINKNLNSYLIMQLSGNPRTISSSFIFDVG